MTKYKTVSSVGTDAWVEIAKLIKAGWLISSVGFDTVNLIKYQRNGIMTNEEQEKIISQLDNGYLLSRMYLRAMESAVGRLAYHHEGLEKHLPELSKQVRDIHRIWEKIHDEIEGE